MEHLVRTGGVTPGADAPPPAAAATPLAQVLAAPPAPPAPTPADLFRRARAAFLKGERIELSLLASETGVSRGTVHRWVGSREQLLGEVLWSLCADTIPIAAEKRGDPGPQGVIDFLAELLRVITTHPGMIHFLESEPEMALRTLTSKRSVIAPRLALELQRLLEVEARAGRIRGDIDLHALAYTLVRISESWIYTDLISGERPDLDQGEVMLRLVVDGASIRRQP
jgi:AcrR family transcriptional regulator